jgi:hypothetical protein
MVGGDTRGRWKFWYGLAAVHRQKVVLVALGLVLLLPVGVNAQEASPPPSAPDAPNLPAAVALLAATDLPAAGEAPPRASGDPDASPEPSGPGASPAPTAAPLPELDFQVGAWELRKVAWGNMRLNGGSVLPAETVGPQDAKGVPMRPLGRFGRLVYNPTVLAQQGLKRLDSYVQTGDKYHLRQARKYAEALKRTSDGGRKRRWQPHWYDLGVHDSGWVNSNSHGLTLSFLSRFHQVTGAKGKLEQARLLFNAFLQRPGNQRWFSNVTAAGYVWFEHWPDGTKDHTLNAHMNAMFGLYDYWQASGDPLAEQYFLGGAKTVRDKLHRFRRKDQLSRYSLAGPKGSLHYHDTHVSQLRILARMTGDRWFERQADRFEKDESAWKVAFRGAPAAGR